jgi:hypothetical protein
VKKVFDFTKGPPLSNLAKVVNQVSVTFCRLSPDRLEKIKFQKKR